MVPESDVHRRLVDMLAAWLDARFSDRDDVAVFARLAWFPDIDDTRIRLDPDVMVVFGRPPGPRRSYKAWEEGDVAPTVLLEVWSEDDTEAGYETRLERARRYGVAEVVLIHPFAPGAVRVEHLAADSAEADRFRATAASVRAEDEIGVETLGIWLAGGPVLRARDEAGVWQPTSDTVEQLQQAVAQAYAQRARADRLAARLRAAGLDPDEG